MVGRQIAALRKSAGLTQAELARHMHVSPSAIGMYEQGRRLPAVPTLAALSQEFNVSNVKSEHILKLEINDNVKFVLK